MDPAYLTIAQASDLIHKFELSPGDLTQACLERITHLDPQVNSYITVTAEQAMDQAWQAQAEIESGRSRGPLHGIPIALKDLYETRGVRTTAGSRFFADYIPEADSVAVQKLREGGAVILGKLNMHEIALGVTNNNPHYGACRNPWALDRSPGGSSGGSGAALAAGLCLGSLGSDTGGSIRIPASLCGVVGLKPTFGRISRRGLIPLSWNLDHAGPLGRCVRDVALLLETLTGYDSADPYSANMPADNWLPTLESGLKGLRVALANDEFFTQIDPEVLQAVQTAAAVFEQLGAQVDPVEFPGARLAALTNGQMVNSDAAAFHRERLAARPEDFGPDVLQRLRSGAGLPLQDYILARHTQVELHRQFERFFDRYDLLLTPTTPIAAPSIEGPDAVEQARRLTRFTAGFNLTGFPALSLPCGFTSQGLPIGLQIVARPWAEAALLQAGYAYEQAMEWHLREPQIQSL